MDLKIDGPKKKTLQYRTRARGNTQGRNGGKRGKWGEVRGTNHAFDGICVLFAEAVARRRRIFAEGDYFNGVYHMV